MPTITNPRVLLWGALALVLLADYNAWMSDYAAPSSAPTEAAGSGRAHAPPPASDLATRVPEPRAPARPSSASEPPASAARVSASAAAAAPATGEAPPGAPPPPVPVRTDVLDVEISTRGGTLVRADLLQYPKVKGEAAPVRLENDDGPLSLYELQSGLAGTGGGPYPTHLASFASAQERYALDGATELEVPLTWAGDNGVSVTKTFVFRRGSYRIDLAYRVRNGGSAVYQVRPYAQILRNDPPTKRSYFNTDSYAFHGPAIWDGKYRKLDVSKDEKLALDVTHGWMPGL